MGGVKVTRGGVLGPRGWREPGWLRSALRLYVVVDPEQSAGRAPMAVADAALEGGATAIQLRHRRATGRELCELGAALAARCASRGALFVVNDRVDVALACGADGVHLGQDDLPAARARAVGGAGLVIGVSAATPAEARRAERDAADYLGVGSVYGTDSKPDAGAPITCGGLAEVVRASTLPVVGIGGIRADRAAQVLEAGAVGVAVISAVCSAADIRAAAAELAAALRGGMAE